MLYMKWHKVPLSTLVGQTIIFAEGLRRYSDEIVFKTAEYRCFRFYHHQDCCETVRLEEFEGDESILTNARVLSAEESTSEEVYKGKPEFPDSFTWVFYRINTDKGTVVLRFLGESNGCYGERMDFEEYKCCS